MGCDNVTERGAVIQDVVPSQRHSRAFGGKLPEAQVRNHPRSVLKGVSPAGSVGTVWKQMRAKLSGAGKDDLLGLDTCGLLAADVKIVNECRWNFRLQVKYQGVWPNLLLQLTP